MGLESVANFSAMYRPKTPLAVPEIRDYTQADYSYEVIIKCIQIFWRHKAPKAPVLPVKRKLPQEAFPGSRLVEPERNSLGSGRPQAEGSSLGTAEGTQRNVTMILLLKSKGVKELLSVRHHFDSSSPVIVTL